MKKWLLIIAALLGLLTTCRDPAGGSSDDPNNPVNPGHKTIIVFDNTEGICAVTVYSSYQRSEENKIAQIPAGRLSQEIEWLPGSMTFYLSYQISFQGISGFSVDYIPQIGKDQTNVRVDPNIKNTITIPTLAEALSSADTLLSDKSYLLIQNNSSYSLQLLRGTSIITPENLSDTLVNSGERAQYTINPGAVSPYQLIVGGSNIPFPASLVSFEAGCVYSFVFNNGALSLTSEVELKLENAAGVSPDKPVPQAPGAPVITASDRLLTVYWTAVEGAESYEVYISTAQNPPALPERTVYSTTMVFTGLTNKTAYYVWVKAVNENGASDLSPRARGIPWPVNEVPAVPERPVIIPGINQLTVNWDDCGGASSYEVHVSTTSSTPSTSSTPNVTSDKTSAVINNLQNDVIYYIWVRAVNNAGKSGYSPVEAGTPRIPTVAPAAPSRPILTAGSRELSVSWQAVELASAYEVWFGTSDDSTQAQKYGGDITGGITETIITGLVNEQTYHVWIKAKNAVGTSDFSPSANVTLSAFAVLPETPETPTVISGNRELTVSWTAVEGALFYEVWTGATSNLVYAEKHGADISGTSVTLTGLDNWTTYYVWVKAKNNIGTSEFSPVASGAPLGTNNERTPGLYRGDVKIGNQNLSASLSYISANAVSGDDFYIVLGADESVSPTSLNYSGKTVGITLLGYGGERTISLNANGSLFTINTGVTLTLDENISLIGINTNNASLVRVNSNGTFIMNGGTISGNTAEYGGGISVSGGTVTMNGGTISGNTASFRGGGIGVGSNGTLTMYDGIISGNNSSVCGGGIYVSGGTVTMYDGIISGNEDTGGYGGGGIYVSGGTVTMNGGTISGNTSLDIGGGIYVTRGTVTMNGGTISGNTAEYSGGGIYVYSNGTLTMYDGTISGNTAEYGGGIRVTDGTVNMNGGTISGNTASYIGGGICGGTVTMNGGTISGNTASSSGGGIYVSGTFTMHGGTISGNTANNGGGVHVQPGGTFKKLPPAGGGQNSGIIYGNEATGVDANGIPLKNDGRAVFVHSPQNFRNTTAGQTDYIDSTTDRGLSANGEPPYGE